MKARLIAQLIGTVASIGGMLMLNAEWGPQGTALYMVVAGCWFQFYIGRE